MPDSVVTEADLGSIEVVLLCVLVCVKFDFNVAVLNANIEFRHAVCAGGLWCECTGEKDAFFF